MLSKETAPPRKTLAAEVFFAGIGLFTGAGATLRIVPARPGQGRYFARVDLPGEPLIPALSTLVADTTRSTSLKNGSASVRTVEHLLAALFLMGVDDARIEIAGPEVPILDGSALPFAEAIAKAGVVSNGDPLPQRPLEAPVFVQAGSAFIAAIPSPEMRFSYGIVFPSTTIGESWFSFSPSPEAFQSKIAPARTFATLDEVKAMQERGMLSGASLDVGIVCDQTEWLNGPLRFPDEPVRHKLLDLLGDLSLVPDLPRAHYVAFKAGHALHVRLAKKLVDPSSDES